MDSYSAPDDVNKESQETHNDISFLSVELIKCDFSETIQKHVGDPVRR